jgi:hypothetical protein
LLGGRRKKHQKHLLCKLERETDLFDTNLERLKPVVRFGIENNSRISIRALSNSDSSREIEGQQKGKSKMINEIHWTEWRVGSHDSRPTKFLQILAAGGCSSTQCNHVHQ